MIGPTTEPVDEDVTSVAASPLDDPEPPDHVQRLWSAAALLRSIRCDVRVLVEMLRREDVALVDEPTRLARSFRDLGEAIENAYVDVIRRERHQNDDVDR